MHPLARGMGCKSAHNRRGSRASRTPIAACQDRPGCERDGAVVVLRHLFQRAGSGGAGDLGESLGKAQPGTRVNGAAERADQGSDDRLGGLGPRR